MELSSILEIVGFALIALCLFDLATVNYSSPIKWLYRLTGSYKVQLVAQVLLFLAGIVLVLQSLVPAFSAFGSVGVWGKIGALMRGLLLLISVVIFMFLFKVAVNPAGLLLFFRNKNNADTVSDTVTPVRSQPWESDYFLDSDVSFDSRYPNNYFDIYSPGRSTGEKRPVFIYVHGGGYVAGSKSNGDPNALGIAGIVRMIKKLVDVGFTVISTNHALAPEYHYPTPVHQMTELLQFLKQHEDEFGIDMSRVVLGGGSAGGQIMAQLANIQTNPQYAQEMQIEPVLGNGEIKAMYHGCALLDNERFARTNSRIVNYIFHQMGRAYFNVGVPEGDPQVISSNVIRYATANYPPSFICDGNAGTFNAQAHDFADRLKSLGVRHKALIFDAPDEGRVPHGFDTLEYPQGYQSMEEMVAFVREEVFGA